MAGGKVIKSTYELAPDVKESLGTWRVQLRTAGVDASEKSIIEALVRSTNVRKVRAMLQGATSSRVRR